MSKSWFEREPFGAFWEKGYRNLNVSCMGGPSFEVAEILPILPKGAKVLDLGCGEGRNAFFLARQGCEVTAVDRSQAGIHKLLTIAKQYDVSLRGIIQDIQEFPLIEEYDVVMGHGVLYYLENTSWRNLLTKVKQHTRPGGFNIFTLFVYNDQYPCVEEIQSAQYKPSFYPRELQEFYSDWIEHRYDQYVKWDAHPGIPLHYHPIEKLVAQKPLKKIIQEPIETGQNIQENDFHSIEMGFSQDELIQKIGQPRAIETLPMEGRQFGSCRHYEEKENLNPQPTVENYFFELWYYGKYVFYMVNGEVTGKALYSTIPMRLKIEEND